jgi:AcrR family transcriptional regulator
MGRSGMSMPAAPAGSLETGSCTALYTKLKPRPNGPGHERVAHHQRVRLHGATLAAVAARGYQGITVSELAALAGISRRTFYERYRDREACFLASYDAIVNGAARRAREAWDGERSAADPAREARDGERGAADDGLARACAALAAQIASEPKAARLAVLEILTAGAAGQERAERTRAALTRALARGLAAGPGRAAPPPDVVRGIAGGMWLVVRRRLLEGRERQLPEQMPELLRWARACAGPAATELPAAAPTLASIAGARGTEARAGERDAHRRALRAAAELAAREGLARVSTGRIAHETGLPETLLTERWGSAQECFLAALELLTAEALAVALRDAQGATSWPEGVRRACATLLRHVAHNGVFARAAFVEVLAAGPAGVERGEALLRGLAELLLRHAPPAQRPSPVVAEAATGAIWEIVRHHVAHRTTRQLPGAAGCAAYMVLAPAIGAEEAVRGARAGS